MFIDPAYNYSINNTYEDILSIIGFLVSFFTLSDFEEDLKTYDYFCMLLKNNELVCFLSTYLSDKIKVNMEIHTSKK